MTSGEIGADYGALHRGSGAAGSNLGQTGRPKGPRGNIDPRLAKAWGDTSDAVDKRRQKIGDKADGTDKFGKGAKDIQEDGAQKVNSVGSGRGMPQVPTSGAAPAPAAAPAAAPASAPAAAPAAVPAPSGMVNIDPELLRKLVEASNAKGDEDRAAGRIPGLSRHAFNGRSATSPQNADPLDVSEVSMEKYGSGPLSQDEIADVIDQALTINGVPDDPDLRNRWQELYQHMALHESGGNPDAINTSDSNAVGPRAEDGAPSNCSRGIWQCIPPTFAAYHMGGTSTSIYDPVASAAASINYVMNTYHVSPDGTGLSAFASARGVGTAGYTGY